MSAKSNINAINDDFTTETVKISSVDYYDMVSKKLEVATLFEEADTIYKQIEKDLEWSGEGKEKYEEVKAFIDKFMEDLPNLFEVLDAEIDNINNILEELFSEESNTIKEFYNYD